jgi:hypothetical protein
MHCLATGHKWVSLSIFITALQPILHNDIAIPRYKLYELVFRQAGSKVHLLVNKLIYCKIWWCQVKWVYVQKLQQKYD